VCVFSFAASLGGVESLVILRFTVPTYNMTNEELQRAGVSRDRACIVGLEDKQI